MIIDDEDDADDDEDEDDDDTALLSRCFSSCSVRMPWNNTQRRSTISAAGPPVDGTALAFDSIVDDGWTLTDDG